MRVPGNIACTRHLRALSLAAATVLSLLFGTTAHAGELSEDLTGSGDCTDHFTGQVAAGDLAKIKARFEDEYGGATLCLDSPGGSFSEALDIAEYLLFHPDSIATRVKTGAVCESACSLIFLAGKQVEEGETYWMTYDRTLEPGARLGFHAPSLGLPAGATYSSSHVTQGFKVAIEAARRAFEMSTIPDNNDAGPRAFASAYVMARFLGTAPEDMYMIDTVGDAILAEIPVTNYSTRVRADERLIRTICDNVYMQSAEGFGLGISARWKSSAHVDAKDLVEEFRALPFVQNGGTRVQDGSDNGALVRFHGGIDAPEYGRLVGYAGGYPDYYIGEAICLVELSTDAKPGETIDHFDVEGAQHHTLWDFDNGTALKVWVVGSYSWEEYYQALRDGDYSWQEFALSYPAETRSPLVLYPFDMSLSDLPSLGGAAAGSQDVADLSCDALWHRRNEIFHNNGYCFGGPRGIAAFGNDGCYTKSPEVSASEANEISRIKEMEKAKGC